MSQENSTGFVIVRNLIIAAAVIIILAALIPLVSVQNADPLRGKFPAVVDIEKGYVLVQLTNTNDVQKFLEMGYDRVVLGNFADYEWPKGILPFYAGDGFYDLTEKKFVVAPPEFLLPLRLSVRTDEVAMKE